MAIVINEIFHLPFQVPDLSGEWFEVYNSGASAIDINGWVISFNDSDTHTISNGGPLLVPPGGYLLLGRDGSEIDNGGITPDYVYGFGINLGNTSGALALSDGTTEIDRVEWDDGVTFPDQLGASLELNDPSLDNNVGGNWTAGSTSFGEGDLGTPGAANTAFCFLPGTMIATPDGPREVTTLSIGDLVQTEDGRTVPVLWVGRQTMTKVRMGEHLQPVRIRAGALANGLPSADLAVTADHGMVIGGYVINASALVNHETIDFVPMAELDEEFTVYHIETEDHDIILANGAPSETFVDTAGRAGFDNYQEYIDLYEVDRIIPEIAMPRISSARLVPEAIKGMLAGRSGEVRAVRALIA